MKRALSFMIILAGASALAGGVDIVQMAQKMAVFDSVAFKFKETVTNINRDDDGVTREGTEKIFGAISFENTTGEYFLKRRIFSLNAKNEFEYAGDSEFSYNSGVITNLWENNGSRFILNKNETNAMEKMPDNYAAAYRVKKMPGMAPLITDIWTNFKYEKPPLFYWNLFKDFKYEMKGENGTEYFYFPDMGMAVYIDKNTLLPEKLEWLTTDDDMRPYVMKRVVFGNYLKSDYGFFPLRMSMELYDSDGLYEKAAYEIDAKSLSFNGVTAESMNIVLPDGCFMNDEISKKSYRVSDFSPDLKKEDVMMKILEGALKKSESIKDAINKNVKP